MPRFHPRHECPIHGCTRRAFYNTSGVCDRCVCHACGKIASECRHPSHRWACPTGAFPTWDEMHPAPAERRVIEVGDSMRLFLRDPIDLEALRNTGETFGAFPVSSMAEYLEHGDGIGNMITLLAKAGATTAWYTHPFRPVDAKRVGQLFAARVYRRGVVERTSAVAIARADAVELYVPTGRVIRKTPHLSSVPRQNPTTDVPAIRGVQHTSAEAAMLGQMLHVADHGVADRVWNHDVGDGLCPARACGVERCSGYLTLSPELDDGHAAVLSPDGVDIRVLFLSLVRARPASRRFDGGGISALVITNAPEWWREALPRFRDLKETGADTRDPLSVAFVPPDQVNTALSYGHVLFDGVHNEVTNADGTLSPLGVRLADMTTVTKWALAGRRAEQHVTSLLLYRKDARMGSMTERAIVFPNFAPFLLSNPIAPPFDADGEVELIASTVRVQDVDFAEAFDAFTAGIEEVGEMWPGTVIPDLTIACNGGKGFRMSGAFSVAAAAAVGAGSDTCPICMGVMMTSRRPVRTACGHTFCTACLDEWVRSGVGQGCPVCRHPTMHPLTRIERPSIESLEPMTTFAPSTAKFDAICEEVTKADAAERLVVVSSYAPMRDQLRMRFPTVPITAPDAVRDLRDCESIIVCDPKCGLTNDTIKRHVRVYGEKRWVRLVRFILQDVEL